MEKYELLKDIGAGNFGVARLMRNKETKELVAMKYIPRGQKVRRRRSGLLILLARFMVFIFFSSDGCCLSSTARASRFAD